MFAAGLLANSRTALGIGLVTLLTTFSYMAYADFEKVKNTTYIFDNWHEDSAKRLHHDLKESFAHNCGLDRPEIRPVILEKLEANEVFFGNAKQQPLHEQSEFMIEFWIWTAKSADRLAKLAQQKIWEAYIAASKYAFENHDASRNSYLKRFFLNTPNFNRLHNPIFLPLYTTYMHFKNNRKNPAEGDLLSPTTVAYHNNLLFNDFDRYDLTLSSCITLFMPLALHHGLISLAHIFNFTFDRQYFVYRMPYFKGLVLPHQIPPDEKFHHEFADNIVNHTSSFLTRLSLAGCCIFLGYVNSIAEEEISGTSFSWYKDQAKQTLKRQIKGQFDEFVITHDLDTAEEKFGVETVSGEFCLADRFVVPKREPDIMNVMFVE